MKTKLYHYVQIIKVVIQTLKCIKINYRANLYKILNIFKKMFIEFCNLKMLSVKKLKLYNFI